MIDVLAGIMEIDSDECVRSALHGLNEFGPNSTNPHRVHELIQALLDSPRPLAAPLRAYAIEVLSGNAQ
jgi:hypothetical protein